MNADVLIVHGGWEGHQPREVAGFFRTLLTDEGFAVAVSDSLDSFNDEAALKKLKLIVPVWTMGKISDQQLKGVCSAVQSGVGMAGCHGGMCDGFRDAPDWHFMTGGQWVAHPGNDGVRYPVHITRPNHPITEGIIDFEIVSEQYYLHVDPAVMVLATTRFPVADGPHVANGPVDMPVIWTKFYGTGRIYYNAVGHRAALLATEPTQTLLRRGCLWAAGALKV